MSKLLEPVQIGNLSLANRVVMAPLTRCRAAAGRVPNEMMAEYYAQRAGIGLILTEATSVTPMGVGYPNTPGIWSDEQVEGWKNITQAVHAAGGKIILQLWHVGRISDPIYLEGKMPVAPSAIKPAGHVSLVRPMKDFETPRALETDEIPAIVEAFRRGAANAKEAGFDGVEIHGANGYLIDQFLQDSTNQRQDSYGGSIENRTRLLMEIVDACLSVWDAGQVGVHLSPRCDLHDMGDSDPSALFGYVAECLSTKNLAFIFTRESPEPDSITPLMRQKFKGAFVVNEGYTFESANAAIESGAADAVAFGKDAIANPDLVERFALNAPLNQWNMETFYGEGEAGYTDYPTLDLLSQS